MREYKLEDKQGYVVICFWWYYEKIYHCGCGQ